MEAEETMQDGESSLFCRLHPAQSVVGICSVCLQEKLGRLVFAERESLFSQQSEVSPEPALETHKTHNNNNTNSEKVLENGEAAAAAAINGGRSRVLLNKSKSVATSSRRVVALQDSSQGHVSRKKGSSGSGSHFSTIWSFFSFGKKKNSNNNHTEITAAAARFDQARGAAAAATAEVEILGKLVTRSRSVGFGSRSFSAAEIYQKSSPVVVGSKKELQKQQDLGNGERCEKQEQDQNNNHNHHGHGHSSSVRCGGLFVGFGGMASSSSSADAGGCKNDDDGCDKAASGCHSRSKSWGWAFSSPLRAFIHSSKRWTNKDASATTVSATTTATLAASATPTATSAAAAASANGGGDSALPDLRMMQPAAAVGRRNSCQL